MYIKKTISMMNGKYVIIEKHFSPRYGKKCSRRSNANTSTDEQKEINKRHADKNRKYKMLCNFEKGDHHIVFSYNKDICDMPESLEDAHKNFTKMLAVFRRKYKDELVYMGKTEVPQKSRIHHHLLIKDAELVRKMTDYWQERYGYVRDVIITSVEDMKLFNYFINGYVSDDKGKMKGGHRVVDCKYTQSRNLKAPEIKTEKINSGRWVKQPKAKKGYRIEDVYNGFDQAGFEMQRYVMIKQEQLCIKKRC